MLLSQKAHPGNKGNCMMVIEMVTIVTSVRIVFHY